MALEYHVWREQVDGLVRGKATSHQSRQLSCPQASPGWEPRTSPGPQRAQETHRKSLSPASASTYQFLTAEQPLTWTPPDTWIRLGLDCHNLWEKEGTRGQLAAAEFYLCLFILWVFFPRLSWSWTLLPKNGLGSQEPHEKPRLLFWHWWLWGGW